jgi:hypothetical protein
MAVLRMQTGQRYLVGMLAGLAALALAGCGGMRTIYLDNGARGYVITCKGYLNSWESCLVQAGKVCRTNGYDTVREEEYDRTLVIACKAPGASK